jgi:hypothetical protein
MVIIVFSFMIEAFALQIHKYIYIYMYSSHSIIRKTP